MNLVPNDRSLPAPQLLGPIGWLFKLLVLFGKVLYYVVRLVIWILRKVFPRR